MAGGTHRAVRALALAEVSLPPTMKLKLPWFWCRSVEVAYHSTRYLPGGSVANGTCNSALLPPTRAFPALITPPVALLTTASLRDGDRTSVKNNAT